MKHTKGEWIFSEYNTGDFSVHSITGDGNDIALVRSKKIEEEGLANARLIAAAPELLEALNDIVQAFDLGMGKSAKTLRIEIAKDVIKKATE